MERKEIRTLRADEIECRVGTINEKGLSLLLYKDARADMKVLDETFGCLGWKRSHQVLEGNLYCTVEIWDQEKQQWIGKQDVGTVSYSEKEKGQASDSFKRACVSIGIGRELYSAPFIWISANKVTLQKRGDRLLTYDKFTIKEILYNEQREIVTLIIVNQDGKVVYEMHHKGGAAVQTAESAVTIGQLEEMTKELLRTGVSLDTVLSRFDISSVQEMTPKIYRSAMNSLKKTETMAA